jgi:hypothetical protein
MVKTYTTVAVDQDFMSPFVQFSKTNKAISGLNKILVKRYKIGDNISWFDPAKGERTGLIINITDKVIIIYDNFNNSCLPLEIEKVIFKVRFEE